MNTEMPSPPQITQAPSGRKEASGTARGLALVLAVLFVILALIGLVGYDFWRVLFNPTLVKEVLTDEVVHSDLVPAVLEAFSEGRAQQRVEKGEALSGVDEPDIVLLMSYINADGWRTIRGIMLTDEFLTHLVSVGVDGVYRWIDSADQWPQVVWDMTLLKTRLVGEEGEEAIMVAYGAMPECTQAEIDDFTARLAAVPPGVEVLYNLCQFPEPWQEDQVSDYVNALIDVNQNLPEQYNFSQRLAEKSISNVANPEMLKSQLRTMRALARWGWLAAILLLALVAALAVRTFKSLGEFIGIPFVAVGLLALAVKFGMQAGLSAFFGGSLLASISPLLRQEVERSLMHLTSEIFQPLLLQGIVFLVVGIGLIVLTIVKGRKPAAAS